MAVFITIQPFIAFLNIGIGYGFYETKINPSAFAVTLMIRLALISVTMGILAIYTRKKVVSTDTTTPVLPPSNI